MYANSSRSINTNLGRIPEYLENLKGEFESLVHDGNLYKMQRDDFERKLQAQMGELTSIQQTVYDLERNHTKIKQQYEEEILRLRRQLEMVQNGSSNNVSNLLPNNFPRSVPNSATNSALNPSQTNLSAGVFYGSMEKRNFPPPPSGTTNIKRPRDDFYPAINSGMNSPTSFPKILPEEIPASKQHKVESYHDVDRQVEDKPPVLKQMNDQMLRLERPDRLERHPIERQSIERQPIERLPVERQSSERLPVERQQSERQSIERQPIDRQQAERQPIDRLDRGERERPDRERLERSSLNNIPPKEEKPKPDIENATESDWAIGFNPGIQSNLNIEPLHTLEHNSVVCCVKFSNDGKWMATGCNKSAQIYDVETGDKVHTFSEDIGKEGDLYIRSVCFSPDNKFLAAGAEDKTVKLWDIENKRMKHTFVGHELDIYSLDFSKDGKFIVSGSGDKKAKIWDVERGECLFTLGNDDVGPKDGVTSVAFSPDGRLVAAGSLDRVVRLWDAQTGYFIERCEGHLDSVYSVAFAPDGKSLASGSLDKTLKLWDLSGGRVRARCRSNFSGHKDFVLSVAFSPDGNWLISGSKDRSVQFWDPKSAVSHLMLQGHKNSVISVAVSPKGGIFATGSGDHKARIWRYE